MANSGGNYRKWIRLGRWDKLEAAMGEIEYQVRTGKGPTGTYATWLMYLLRESVGDKVWDQVNAQECPK